MHCSGVHFLMVDFEDSSTVALDSLLTGLKYTTLANRRALDYTAPSGQRFTVLPHDEKAGPLALISVRLEGS